MHPSPPVGVVVVVVVLVVVLVLVVVVEVDVDVVPVARLVPASVAAMANPHTASTGRLRSLANRPLRRFMAPFPCFFTRRPASGAAVFSPMNNTGTSDLGAKFGWQRACLALLVAAALAPADALAAPTPVASERAAKAVFLGHPKVERWLERYPRRARIATARFQPKGRAWHVSVLSGKAGEIATGEVDTSGRVVRAWVGPEVAWPLARGDGLGGILNRPLIWLCFCLVFLLGLANLRKPLSIRNLDLLVVLSFSLYIWYFNQGRVFASAAAAAGPLVYLIGRCGWIGWTNRASPVTSVLPVWLLVAATVLLVGFRVGLNAERSEVIDVGYAGVIGADRLANGKTPYGNFPVKDTGNPCGRANVDGEIRDWIQSNGRCETPNPLGDTYGPVNYHAYLPGLWLFDWSGKWDSLHAVHFTTIVFDLLAILGLAAVGFRFGGVRLAALLAFAWAASPLTQYVSSSNTNDAIMPALLIWGFWAASSPAGRGAFAAAAAWTKLAALIIVPLWATYPEPRGRRSLTFIATFAVVTVLSFWVLILRSDPADALRVFYERTFEIQADRTSPFSLWDWGQYHARGIPDLEWVQKVLQVLVVGVALALSVVPRRKSPLQLAALTAALLMGFQFVLTHWSGLYIAWFFPFLALAVLAGPELGGVAPERLRQPRLAR